MALQASGAISIDDIVAEFGGAAPDGLTEYYRGGAYVPDTAANSGIPTSGAIGLEDFYSASAVTIVAEFDQATYQAHDDTERFSSGSIAFNTDGTITVTGNLASPTSGTWATGGTVTGGDWEIFASLTTGSSPSGPALNNWHALSTARTWTLSTFSGTDSGTLEISLRDASTAVLQDTCTVTFGVGGL